jgi:phenylacetate-CoA ligase
VVGGEGMSEGLRRYLLKSFRTVVSAYGASDLEINVGVETEWTIALRARCAEDAALCRDLFGRDTPPMIFQYNALDYHVETTAAGTLVFTICRDSGAAPKIRYDLKDIGGGFTFRALAKQLVAHGLDPGRLVARHACFPILFVYGRADLTAAFYGAKVYPADFEATILGHPQLAPAVASFQFAVIENERLDRRMAIDLELVEDAAPEALGVAARDLGAIFYAGLAASNQDFREVSRLFTAAAIDVTVHPCGTGPFAGADVRIKRQYVRR